MKKIFPWILGIALAIGAFLLSNYVFSGVFANRDKTESSDGESQWIEDVGGEQKTESGVKKTSRSEDESADGEEDSEDAEEEESENADEESEAEEDAEQQAVDVFDELTDEWQEPSKKEVTMDDVSRFASTFKKVPESRREECIQRALNLIPDENVMLLAGILMDRSLDEELIQTVFNDVLNRDEDVKKPIMEQIFKDKTHPCWADVAWILDVTGELPSEAPAETAE